MKEICKECKNTKCEQIREDVVERHIVMQSPELLAGRIERCPRKKPEVKVVSIGRGIA